MEENSRKEEIKEKFLYNDVTDGILEYSVQEIIYLYSLILEELKNTDKPDEEMEKRKLLVFRAIMFRVMRSEKIYMAFHAFTGYPYADVRGNAWIFSQKEYAGDAMLYYHQKGIPLHIKEYSGQEEIFNGLFELYRLGINSLVIDNGKQSVTVYRSDILHESEMEGLPENVNPQMMYLLISLNELGYATDGKHKDIPEMEKMLFKCLAKGKFLVPAKMDEHVSDGEIREIKDPVNVQLALFKNNRSNDEFVPAFTDWQEFIKLYSKDEWNAVVMDYSELKRAAEKVTGFMINPMACGFAANREVIKKIDSLA